MKSIATVTGQDSMMPRSSTVSITVSQEAADWLDGIAADREISREEALDFVRDYYDLQRRWARIQREGQAAAARLGITTEEELEAFLDSIDDD
jgi:predicted transcriptional regulator